MAELFYIYRKRIQQHGYNDGYDETNELDHLLTITNDAGKATAYQPRFEYEFYKRLEQSLILSSQQVQDIGRLFNQPADYLPEDLLKNLSFTDYQKLAAHIRVQFTHIKTCEPDPQKFYPLLNHHLLMKAGLETLNPMELEDLIDNLSSTNPEEAFEKGLFFLLAMNFIPGFIGDPETTLHDAEFRERQLDRLLKLQQIFQPPADLISRHGGMKFWLIENGYPRYAETFPDFLKNKECILGDNLALFNKLAAFFKAQNEKIIYVVNVC